MNHRLAPILTALSVLLVTACSGGGESGQGTASQMDLDEVSNGFGLLLPHQVFRPDAQGLPTQELIAIRDIDDLLDNVRPQNPILPVTQWPVGATLPNGDAGNHYIFARFKQPIQIESVLDPSPGGQANSGLLGPITVLALNPANGQSVPVQGRAFIGGKTFAGQATGSPPELELQQWVRLNPDTGQLEALDVGDGTTPGLGFPGTMSGPGFPDAAKLVSETTFVFIPDSNGDLTDFETFPANRQIRLRASTAVFAANGNPLRRRVLASATVGPDTLPPEVATTPPPNSVPITTPSFGDVDVDPTTTITMEFTEPVQPLTLMSLPDNRPPPLSSAIEIKFGPSTQITQVPFTGLPPSVFDLSVWEFTTVFAFPGNGPAFQSCGTFNRVTVDVIPQQFTDMAANLNTFPASTHFVTGEGPGLVNAPVVPDAIYAVRSGATPGLSVIDINGFGQSTGNPQFDFTFQSFPKGWSNFPNNPNVRQHGSTMFPPIFPGTCTVDGGSAGVFTLTLDSSLNDLLVKPPVITSAGEMMIGQSLDLIFYNGNEVTGCQSGGGNVCAITGKKVVLTAFQTSQTLGPPLPGQLPAANVPGGANPVSFAPHPNPPPLRFPPLCIQPFIGGAEPTSIYTMMPVPLGGLGFSNLLIPGSPLGDPLNGIPPSGILAKFQNSYFVGPDRPSLPSADACFDHQYRQQIGHFLYLIDRARREIVVLNSNRMTVLDRIPVPDPTDLAMGPQLDFLAVSNQNADSVSFIDINPLSSSFHQVMKTTSVGRGPRGLAWDPGNEDILVCNEQENSVSIISAFSLNVRKVVKGHLNQPFDVAITQRQTNFGFLRQVYFGWIINRNGDLTIFESGPDGVNGWGYDNTIGVAPFTMRNPKKIQVDFADLRGAVWIAHEDPIDPDGNPTGVTGGAVSQAGIESAVFGILPLNGFNFFINPNFRDMTIKVRISIGPDQLTGIPTDIAFDELNNLGAMQNFATSFSVGFPILINGKSYVRPVPGSAVASKYPDFMFVAVPNSTEGPGAVDVIRLTSGFTRFDTDKYLTGVQSIPVPGVRTLMDYWRQ